MHPWALFFLLSRDIGKSGNERGNNYKSHDSRDKITWESRKISNGIALKLIIIPLT